MAVDQRNPSKRDRSRRPLIQELLSDPGPEIIKTEAAQKGQRDDEDLKSDPTARPGHI